jgi:hypothetical protein
MQDGVRMLTALGHPLLLRKCAATSDFARLFSRPTLRCIAQFQLFPRESWERHVPISVQYEAAL